MSFSLHRVHESRITGDTLIWFHSGVRSLMLSQVTDVRIGIVTAWTFYWLGVMHVLVEFQVAVPWKGTLTSWSITLVSCADVHILVEVPLRFERVFLVAEITLKSAQFMHIGMLFKWEWAKEFFATFVTIKTSMVLSEVMVNFNHRIRWGMK